MHADHSHDAALLKRFRRATERRLHVLRDLSKRKDALILARNESVPARERAANVRAEPLVQVFFSLRAREQRAANVHVELLVQVYKKYGVCGLELLVYAGP